MAPRRYKMHPRTLALGLICLCAFSHAERQHHYRLDFTGDLDSVAVTAQLANPGVALVASGLERRHVTDLATCGGTSIAPPRRGRVQLPAGVECISYTARLLPVRGRGRWTVEQEGVRVTSSRSWLLLPRLHTGDRVQLRVTKPDHVDLSVPWVRSPGETNAAHSIYELRASPRSDENLVVIGQFVSLDLSSVGLRKPAALTFARSARGTPGSGEIDVVEAWLLHNFSGIRRAFGRIPNPQAQIVVMGARSEGSSPVPFGHVIRDQGETIRFFVDPQRSLAAFKKDWTAVHEISHLLLPYVEEKWIAEGFASYYQNVLQARLGEYSQTEAWGRLARSFARGRDAGRNVSPNGTRDAPFWEVRMMVYWSGAALALMADVELREQSGGAQSLDTVLARLGECCLPGETSTSGRVLFEQLDRLAGRSVFVALYDQYADQRGMPDTGPLMQRLGVSGAGVRAQLSDTADLSHIRRAITQSLAR